MGDNNTRETFLDIVLDKFIPDRTEFLMTHMNDVLQAFERERHQDSAKTDAKIIESQSVILSERLQRTLLLGGLCAVRQKYTFAYNTERVTIPSSFEDVVKPLNVLPDKDTAGQTTV